MFYYLSGRMKRVTRTKKARTRTGVEAEDPAAPEGAHLQDPGGPPCGRSQSHHSYAEG